MNELETLELLTVKEVAEILKSTPKSIHTYLSGAGSKPRNKFPSHLYRKIGRKILFIKPKLVEWILAGAKMEKTKVKEAC
ncbi:MAG TPA: helix-turn-helix domain-containing protein [Candidatus Gastranaerophilales bacterium]|nr:helix-turn-helix domain-containing protein [Candidatus Gastranaerophilales bacterium]